MAQNTVAVQCWTFTNFRLYSLASGHRVTSGLILKVLLKDTTFRTLRQFSLDAWHNFKFAILY